MALTEQERRMLRRILRQAIRQLPQPHRAIGELYLLDYRLTQIARAVGIPWEIFWNETWREFLQRMRHALRGQEAWIASALRASQ